MKKIVSLIICSFVFFALVSCAATDVEISKSSSSAVSQIQETTSNTVTSTPSSSTTVPASTTSTSELETITGVSYANASYDYDGTAKEALVTGTLPQGVTAVYSNNSKTDAGTYTATVTLSGEGYQTLVLESTLTINKIDITGALFED